MKSKHQEHDSGMMQRRVGLFLVVGAVLVGLFGLDIAGGQSIPSWLSSAYLVWAVCCIAAYLLLVFQPQRRREREQQSRHQSHFRQNQAFAEALDELRFGDLVTAVKPAQELQSATARALETAVRALAGLIEQIQGSTIDIATAAADVKETSSDLASGSSQQAAAVVQITATMEELAATAGQIAINAAAQADLASRSEEAGTEGVDAVEAAVSGIDAVSEHMETIASRADTLGSRSREIYRVLDLINEIAQQTHILSLNAAIEASAAGDQGERFSAVADEVRRLAERSRESTQSVRSMLDEFSGAIRGMVVATEEGSKAAATVLQRSRSAEATIVQLSSALGDTAQTAREISLATQQQRAASDQVVLTIKEVSEVIQRMAVGLQQFTGTAQRLNQIALSIHLLTQSFRTDSPGSLKHLAVAWADKLASFIGNAEAVNGCLNEVLRVSPFLEVAYLADNAGTWYGFVLNQEIASDEVTQAAMEVVGTSCTDRPWFQAVVKDQRTVVTPQYTSMLTSDQCFTIASPVWGEKRQMVGVLGLDVNVRNWTSI